MWNDIETTQDFLNFSVIADTVAELIVETDGQPISIGVSGNWGAGKSSMVKMIGESLKIKDEAKEDKDKDYVFLEFNAWLYQGYDDARTALLQAVTDKLLEESKKRDPKKNFADKVKAFSKRVNWLQIAKLIIPLSVGLMPGGAAVGGIASLIGAFSGVLSNSDKDKNAENSEELNKALESLSPDIKEMLKESASKSIPQQIEKLRKDFEELLSDMNITLVVLVDDLDRCLPTTAISTLEAMRLLLFVKRTAFIIAADEHMIRSSVKAHFSNVEMSDGLVTSYFDKLIQIPLSVPHLGIAEVKIYMVSLFAELAARRKEISNDELSSAMTKLQALLRDAWKGGISKAKIEGVFSANSVEAMRSNIEISEQLAGILVTADGISGNPRLIKRFLNTIVIRDKVAKLNGITVDFGSLVKMILFERCAAANSFEFLVKSVAEADKGKPLFLKEIETAIATGKDPTDLDDSWKSKFITEWLKLEPLLGDTDLRPLLYLSRDRLLSLAAYDELTKEALEVLSALETVDNTIIIAIVESIKSLGEIEAEKVLSRIARIGRTNQWETKTLVAALHITGAYGNLGSALVSHLNGIPAKARKAAFIPHLRDKTWAAAMLTTWADDSSTPDTTIKSIQAIKGAKGK
jgi:predicted KAP-like P-loop ATPase